VEGTSVGLGMTRTLLVEYVNSQVNFDLGQTPKSDVMIDLARPLAQVDQALQIVGCTYEKGPIGSKREAK
jgi:hypothetical protein